jgi:hypothetical protein
MEESSKDSNATMFMKVPPFYRKDITQKGVNEVPMPTVNYENLLEWMRFRKIHRKDLAATAGRVLGSNVSPNRVGSYIKEGRPMPGEYIMAWQKAYKWTDQETMFFCLGGDIPRPEKEKPQQIIAINIEDLIELAERRKK